MRALHDDVTRAWLFRRWAAGLALAAVLLVLGPLMAAAQPVAVEVVKPGREGLELTARLTEDGGLITRDIAWTIRAADGEILFASEAGSVDISLPPGDYTVEAAYGAAIEVHTVSVPERVRLMVSLILKAGGLRIDAGMGETAFPAARPQLRVFALGSGGKGRLVASGEAGGGIIRLPEGRYRVESRAAAGNAVAVSDVVVKAGRGAAPIRGQALRRPVPGAPASALAFAFSGASGLHSFPNFGGLWAFACSSSDRPRLLNNYYR